MAYQTILSGQQSTAGSPYCIYTVEVEPFGRTSSSISVNVTVTAHLKSSQSFLGLAHTLIGTLNIAGADIEITIKASSESWTGTANHTSAASGTISGLGSTETSLQTSFSVVNTYGNAGTMSTVSCSNLSIPGYSNPVNTIKTTAIPSLLTGYDGDKFSFSTTPSGGTGYNYRWYKDGSVVSSSKTFTGTLSNSNYDGSVIYCFVWDSTGGSVYTNKCQVRVGTSESKKTVSTHQIIPARVYNGNKFLYGIPFVKSGSSLMYCNWTIKK
jgi:hypothetical protein